MKNLCLLTITWFLSITLAIYAPESGDDWSLLKPIDPSAPDSFETVPFEFGIIVTPFVIDEEGKLSRPPLSSFTKSHTTTFTTSVVTVTQAPIPTKDIQVYQIQDGQVQNYPNYNGGESVDEEEPEELEDSEESEPTDPLEDPLVEDDCGDEEEEQENKYKYSYNKREWDDCGDEEEEEDYPVFGVACKKPLTLVMRLNNSILRDSENRIGSIVSGHQFQFDGPVPQHGTIYAAGWSITSDGQLALGGSTKFFQCASGEFYNLYDRAIGGQCFPVVLDIVELKDC